MNDPATEPLFSYGTLQLEPVQLATFGRRLEGAPDALPGYRMDWLELTDADAVAASGTARHPVVRPTGNPADRVPGVVFRITPEELRQADGYEAEEYRRDWRPLASGAHAWVYVDARTPP
jgi:hypothetical protein